MAERPAFDDLPNELLVEILSWLPWKQQLVVRRVCGRWRAAADASLALRRELTIGKDKSGAQITTERLVSLLKGMPTLQTLSIFGMIFYRPTLERLCFSSPQLQEISLDGEFSGRAVVHTLLRLLPQLRSVRLHRTAEEHSRSILAPRPGRLSPRPLMRELHLSGLSICSTELEAVLAACPQLERLAVVSCFIQEFLRWLPELRSCPQLLELHISPQGMTRIRSYDHLPREQITCPRLERLGINSVYARDVLPMMSLPRLTHLEIPDTNIQRLTELLPRLRDLRLRSSHRLTDNALGELLPRLTSLQVLDVRDTEVGLTDTVISRLSALPLKALACRCLPFPAWPPQRQSRPGHRLHQVISRCPSLVVICTSEQEMISLAYNLIRDPVPQHREVTLITELGPGTGQSADLANLASRLPGNIRLLVEAGSLRGWRGGSQLRAASLWERYSGWGPFWAL